MNNKVQIQLGSTENINSVNVDNYIKFDLLNNQNKLLEYDIRNVLSVSEIFDNERQSTQLYRIYGGIEYLSLLNGIKKEYEEFSDFFDSNNCILGDEYCPYKSLLNSFDFYLVRPYSRYKISTDSITYGRYFEVVATPDDFDLYEMGYSKNIFGEQKYGFIFNKDFDVSSWFDGFGFPNTDVYLYAFYKKSTNGLGRTEVTYRTSWSSTKQPVIGLFQYHTYEIGDLIRGDVVEYSKSTFFQTVVQNQTYYIRTYYDDEGTVKHLQWKYNPFIKLDLRFFNSEYKTANVNSTVYEQAESIPDYATNLDNGNYVWREILPQGYIDPITGIGVDYPFVNKRRYLFSNLILAVIPDLNDSNTSDKFSEINFADPTIINYSPNLNSIDDDITNIGKPCQ